MLQDRKGYMWIGSQDGINRYNGLSFFQFDAPRYYAGCQPFKEVFGLVEDGSGDIWIGSAQGLYRYSQRAEKFSKVQLPRGNKKQNFFKPFALVNGEVWVTDGNLCFYGVSAKTNKNRVLFKSPGGLPLQEANFLNPQVDNNGNIWTVCSNQIVCIDVHAAAMKQFAFFPGKKADAGAEVRSIALEAASGVLGISTIQGLILFDIIKQVFIPVNDPASFVSNTETNFIKAEGEGFLLAARGHPLLQLDARGKAVVSLLDTQTTGSHLPASYEVVCLYKDRWGRIWCSMDGEFIGIVDFSKPFFKKLTKDMRNGLPQGTISCISPIGDSVLVNDGKLTLFNKKTGLIEKLFMPLTLPDAPSEFTTNWYDSTKQRIWLASRETVFYYDFHEKKLIKTRFSFADNIDYINPIRGFSRISNDVLIITTTIGIYLWDEKSNTSRRLEIEGNATPIFTKQLSGNRLAVTTSDKQLHLYRTYSNSIRLLASRRFEYIVNGLAEDSGRNILWAATEQGIHKIDNALYEVLRHYTKADGMSKDLVYSIECDRFGWVWCSTNRGIVALDPVSEHIINFDGNDNLQDLEFNRGAVANDWEGYIYFGGVKGINYFKPPFHRTDTVEPQLVIEDISINNQLLDKGFAGEPTEISYSYGAALLSLKVIALHLKNAPAYKVIYRLNRNPSEWVEIDNGTSIQFFDLAPGRYALEIGYRNEFSGAKRAVRTLAIVVLPPWYQTWWFYTLCSVVLATLLYGYFRLRLQQRLKILQIRNRLHRDLHDDVGATLSSIKAYSEILGRNGSDRIIQGLIKENATEMIDRLEVIAWATNPQYDNAKSLMDAMLKFAGPLTHAKGVELQLTKIAVDDTMMIPGDFRQHIFLIFKEAVNNMLKYAAATKCSVLLCIRNHTLQLEVTDNGRGCDGETKGSGAGMKNMQKRASEMGGQIQFVSATGKGTYVRLSVPYPFKTTTTKRKETV